MKGALVFLAAALAGAASSSAQPAPMENEDLIRARLERRLSERVAGVDGVVGVWIKDLASGWEVGVHHDRLFPTASSIKVAILVELYRQAGEGRFRLDERHRIEASEKTGGSGVLNELGDGTVEMSLRDLAVLMILVSDNTATNILIDRVGMDSVNSLLDRMGLVRTRLRRKMIRPDEQARGNENVSTPEEMGKLVEAIYRGEILTPEACRDILDILARPKTGSIRTDLPSDVSVADKTGSLAGVANDVGVVLLEGRPFIVSAMTSYLKNGDEAEEAIADVARLAYDVFWRLSVSNAYGARLPRELVRRD